MFGEIDKKKFDNLLNWLDPDREKAARLYEKIRKALIKYFIFRGGANAEDLTDKTFDRVALKIETIETNFDGEKTRYFIGVARNVINETHRNRETQINEATLPEFVPDYAGADEKEILDKKSDCFKSCLSKLDEKHRKLIVDYYSPKKNKKSKQRKKIIEKKSYTINALRNQIFRIKNKLFNCYQKCIREKKS